MGLASLALLLLLTRGASVADSAIHLGTAEGIVARGSTALAFDPGGLVVTTEPLAGGLVYMDEAGRVRSSQTPGFALVALPFVTVGHAIAVRRGAPPLADRLEPWFLGEGESYRELLAPLARDPRAIGMSLVGPLAGGLSLAFVWLALAALAVPRRRRAWIVVALLLSPLGAFAGTCWTQPVTAAAIAFSVWRVAESCAGARASGWATGVALAVAVAVRPDHAPLVPGIALALATPRDGRPWDRGALLGVALPVAGALFGLWLYGAPQPAGGWSLRGLADGLPGLLASPLSGLLVYAPFVALAPFGVAPSPRTLRWLLAVPALQLLLYGGWFDWDATLALGPRFLVPSLPVLAVFAALAPPRALPALTALGGLVNAPAHLLAHARVPEMHAFFRPAFLDAWRTLLGRSHEAVGAGVDCASTHVAFYGWAALAVALVGAALRGFTRPRARPRARGASAPRR